MLFLKQLLLWGVIIIAFSPFAFFLMPFIAAFVIIVAIFFEFSGWHKPVKGDNKKS